MNLHYTIADAKDYHALHGLLQICGEHMHRTKGLSHWYPFRNFAYFEQEVAPAKVYAVYLDDFLAGTFYLSPLMRPYYEQVGWQATDKALYLGGVGVLPFTQGRGVGRWLMQTVDALVQEQGYDLLRFDCVATNMPLLAFYDHLGYERCGGIEFRSGILSPGMCYKKVF